MIPQFALKAREAHILELFSIVLYELSNSEAHRVLTHLREECFGGRAHCCAVRSAILTATSGAPADDRVCITDVNAALRETGALTNSNVEDYWLRLVSPPSTQDWRPGRHRLNVALSRVKEDRFRELFATYYRWDNAWTAPLEDLFRHITDSRAELLKAYSYLKEDFSTLRAMESEAA